MLRLIGAIVIALLIIGPLLAQAGLLDHAGLLRDLVDLEVRSFVDVVNWFRRMTGRSA
jgi:hypothetical protein